MNKFVLFGDSYVDPLKVNAGKCWSDLLARDGEVINYGKSGTGPDYSIDLLEKYYQNEYEGYEVIIFFVGFPCRFNFIGLDHPGHSVDVSNLHYWEVESLVDEDDSIFRQWCKDNEWNLKFYYENAPIKRNTEYHLGWLRNFSELLGVRLIAVLQENPYVDRFYNLDNPEEWSVPIPQKVLDLSGDKFSVYPFNIASVSRKEFVTLENDATGKIDTRQNHLTDNNHVVLYKNIISILEHEPTKEHILFREDFDTWYKPHTGFIYDE